MKKDNALSLPLIRNFHDNLLKRCHEAAAEDAAREQVSDDTPRDAHGRKVVKMPPGTHLVFGLGES